MAHIVNPNNLDDDDDAVFSALLSQGLIWIEDDDENDGQPDFAEVIPVNCTVSRTLRGHKGRINSLAVTGSCLISASADGNLRVWNWETGQQLHTLTGHTNSINSVSINGDFAITASSDKTLRVWNWKSGQQIRTLSGSTHSLSALDMDGDVVVSASFGEVRIWNWQTGEHLQTLRNTWDKSGHHENSVSLVAIDGDAVLSYSSQPDIFIVRNWRTGERIHHFRVEYLVDEECSIVVTGSIVAILDDNNPDILLWDWKSGQRLNKKQNPTHATENMVFLTTYGVCSFFGNGNWPRYNFDTEGGYVGVFRFVEDRSHIVRGGHNGDIQIIAVESFLRNLMPDTSKLIADYEIGDIVAEIRDYVRSRNETWINLTRVSQHIHRVFPNLKVKALGTSNKRYKSFPKLIEDHPSDFELRLDPKKQGLYWIRLKQSR